MWRPGGAPGTLGVWSPVGVAALGICRDENRKAVKAWAKELRCGVGAVNRTSTVDGHIGMW